jgi:hypothetical protein
VSPSIFGFRQSIPVGDFAERRQSIHAAGKLRGETGTFVPYAPEHLAGVPASFGLIQQYQSMTPQQRQAAGISSNFLDVAVSNYNRRRS